MKLKVNGGRRAPAQVPPAEDVPSCPPTSLPQMHCAARCLFVWPAHTPGCPKSMPTSSAARLGGHPPNPSCSPTASPWPGQHSWRDSPQWRWAGRQLKVEKEGCRQAAIAYFLLPPSVSSLHFAAELHGKANWWGGLQPWGLARSYHGPAGAAGEMAMGRWAEKRMGAADLAPTCSFPSQPGLGRSE